MHKQGNGRTACRLKDYAPGNVPGGIFFAVLLINSIFIVIIFKNIKEEK